MLNRAVAAAAISAAAFATSAGSGSIVRDVRGRDRRLARAVDQFERQIEDARPRACGVNAASIAVPTRTVRRQSQDR